MSPTTADDRLIPPPPLPATLTVTEVTQRLPISRARLYELVASGELRAYRVGAKGYYRFTVADVDALVKQVGA